MSDLSERRRKPRKKPVRPNDTAWVLLEGVPGSVKGLRAKVIDASEAGVGVELHAALEENSFLVVKNDTKNVVPSGKARVRVVRCWSTNGDVYNAGLAYEEEFVSGKKPAPVQAVPDYYEALQVNPKADADMIHRVYRLLAQRYHPDNTATGDPDIFRSMLNAYQVLSDPEKRAAYDVHLEAYRRFRWQLFHPGDATVGKLAERSKRRALLELLYTSRMNQPQQPTMSLHEFEDLLGCPREHLEFSLWYLRENGLIVRSDNGRYAITAKGVDQSEQEEAQEQTRRLLAAG